MDDDRYRENLGSDIRHKAEITEMNARMGRIEKRLDSMEKRVGSLETQMIIEAIRNGQGILAAKIDNMTSSNTTAEALRKIRQDVADGLRAAAEKIA